jgi:hypothetical protein
VCFECLELLLFFLFDLMFVQDEAAAAAAGIDLDGLIGGSSKSGPSKKK